MNMQAFKKIVLILVALTFTTASVGKENRSQTSNISPQCTSALIRANHHVSNQVYNLFIGHIKADKAISVKKQKAFGTSMYNSSSAYMDDIIRQCPKSVVKELQDGLPM